MFQRSDFKQTQQLYLGYKQSWLIQLWIRFPLIVFARRHRIWLSITSVILNLFTWTPLNSTVVPMTQQTRKGNNENKSLHASCSSNEYQVFKVTPTSHSQSLQKVFSRRTSFLGVDFLCKYQTPHRLIDLCTLTNALVP